MFGNSKVVSFLVDKLLSKLELLKVVEVRLVGAGVEPVKRLALPEV